MRAIGRDTWIPRFSEIILSDSAPSRLEAFIELDILPTCVAASLAAFFIAISNEAVSIPSETAMLPTLTLIWIYLPKILLFIAAGYGQ
jgi:hypothetical protein